MHWSNAFIISGRAVVAWKYGCSALKFHLHCTPIGQLQAASSPEHLTRGALN